MAEPTFKVVTGAGDWGSPLSVQPTFATFEEAAAAAREYLREQRAGTGAPPPLHVRVEETRADGTVALHPIG